MAGFEKYIGSIGIDASEVIAMGDDNNDIELIANSGLGIAMKMQRNSPRILLTWFLDLQTTNPESIMNYRKYSK